MSLSERITAPKNWKPVAFKEWDVVLQALASGEQSLLLRKGGISEGKHGFQWIHDRFFFYPSLFHEQGDQVKLAADGSPRGVTAHHEVNEGRVDPVPFSLYAETIQSGRITDWSQVEALEPFHIWKAEIVRERFDWGEEPGISFALVQVWELSQPWILKDRSGFGGCRSWMGLPSEENGSWETALEKALLVEPKNRPPQELLA